MLRFLWLVGFSFWIGGFVFYASYVVPILRREAGESAFLTKHVAPIFNGVGVVVLASWFVELALGWRQAAWRRTAFGLLVVNAVVLALLFWAYGWVAAGSQDFEEPEFRFRHRVYLWLHTVQFLLAVGSLAVSLRRWQETDRTGETLRPQPG